MSRKVSSVPLFEGIVSFEYVAVEASELSVPQGAIVSVREVNESGWCLVKYEGKAGWIPTDYVEKLEGVQSVPDAAPVAEPSAVKAEPLPPAAPDNATGAPNEKEVTDAVNKLALESKKDVEVCAQCNQPVTDRFVVAKGKHLHVTCFTCSVCSASLAGKPFIEKDEKYYCEDDYYRTFNPACGACNDVIKGQYVNALGQAWHRDCFVCSVCNQPFPGNRFRKYEEKPYCEADFNKMFGTSCSKCGEHIDSKIFEALGKKFHEACFTCEEGNHQIGVESHFHVFEDKVYCPQHFEALFLEQCAGCGQTITDEYIKVADKHYHPQCWNCADCGKVLDRSQVSMYQGKFVCPTCHGKTVATEMKSNAAAAAAPATPAPGSPAPTTTNGPSKPPAPVPTPVSMTAAEGGAESFFSLSALQKEGGLPPNVDVSKRETYLSPEVFERIFKMTKDEFAKLKDWKKKQLKQSVGLF